MKIEDIDIDLRRQWQALGSCPVEQLFPVPWNPDRVPQAKLTSEALHSYAGTYTKFLSPAVLNSLSWYWEELSVPKVRT